MQYFQQSSNQRRKFSVGVFFFFLIAFIGLYIFLHVVVAVGVCTIYSWLSQCGKTGIYQIGKDKDVSSPGENLNESFQNYWILNCLSIFFALPFFLPIFHPSLMSTYFHLDRNEWEASWSWPGGAEQKGSRSDRGRGGGWGGGGLLSQVLWVSAIEHATYFPLGRVLRNTELPHT